MMMKKFVDEPVGIQKIIHCEGVIWKMQIIWSVLPRCSFTFCRLSPGDRCA